MADDEIDETIRVRTRVVRAAPNSSGTMERKPDSRVPSPTPTQTGQVPRIARRKRKGLLVLVACAIIAGAAAALWQWRYNSRAQAEDPATMTAHVIRRDFTSSVLATGAVKPQVGAEVRVGARISGKVEKLRANIGDSIRVGQVIAELEKADLEAVVAQRQAEVELAKAKLSAVASLCPKQIEKAEADLARRQATLTLARQDTGRLSQLLPQNAVSRDEWERGQERMKVAEAELCSAEKSAELAKTGYVEDRRQAAAELARAESALSNAQVQLSYATLVAPISGVIASVSTQEGETVAAGLNSPTFVTIIDLERLQVDAMVDEVDIGKVHPGQRATFTVDTFPAREFSGQVVAIYPKAVLLENVVYYDVVVEIQGNEDKVLRPEMTASVTILLDAKTDVLAIPAKAVKRDRGKNVVYVVSNGQPQPREIKVGWKDGNWIEVITGLKEGETILHVAPIDAPAGS
ncbi:MAG: efflux RND transporter periplasmic adaptor subunit [Pirellulaceae bacterium]|jgi:multidrug efflux pump subunit AcrA (membrane-fusion protein)